MIKKFKNYFLYMLATSVLACSPTIKNFDQYQKHFISKSQFLPSEKNLSGEKPKIVVFALDENGNNVATQATLGITIANNIENVLSQNKLAQIVDRGAAKKLQKEIELAEVKKTGVYKGPQVAEYAISGSISNASFASKYSSGTSYFDPRSKTFVSIPPRFTYSSSVSGNIKIYELPSMEVVESIAFDGSKSRSENVAQNGGVSLGAIQIGGEKAKAQERDDGIVREAALDAIESASVDIKNALSQKGYILEKRALENKSIFKINIGSLDGVQQGDELEIIGQYEIENSITGKIEIEKRFISKAKVSDKIDPKTSWIII